VRHRAARFSLTRFSTAESSTTGALDDWRLVGSCQPSVFGCQVRALCGHRRRTSGRGHRGTPRHRSKFASLDVYSAWRLLPDVQTGIAHIKSDNTFHEVVAGVLHAGRPRRGERPLRRSARHATCTALHCTALHQGDAAGPRPPRISGRVFDGSLLATAAVSAPQIVVNSVGDALDGFRDLPDEESEILVATFRVWQDNDSVRVTAQQLIVHPNTVRHRLRRIKDHTGRSLSRPCDGRRTMFDVRGASPAHVA
jgi:hypothetical protein